MQTITPTTADFLHLSDYHLVYLPCGMTKQNLIQKGATGRPVTCSFLARLGVGYAAKAVYASLMKRRKLELRNTSAIFHFRNSLTTIGLFRFLPSGISHAP